MNPLRTAHSRDSDDERRRRRVGRTKSTGSGDAFPGSETRADRLRTLLTWLVLPLLIALTMQACGWVSLLGAKAMALKDTRARIQADYSPWPFMSFLPIDPAILVEISEETGRTIGVIDGDPTNRPPTEDPAPTPSGTVTGEPTSAQTPGVTPTAGSVTPTATGEGPTSATATATATPPPPATPTTQGYKHTYYTSTPGPSNPKATDDS